VDVAVGRIAVKVAAIIAAAVIACSSVVSVACGVSNVHLLIPYLSCYSLCMEGCGPLMFLAVAVFVVVYYAGLDVPCCC